MLECNQNYPTLAYATLVFNCILKNSKKLSLASEINKRYRNNNIEND